jgi:hypothetical protein
MADTMVEQRRLADSRFPAHDDGRTLAGLNLSQQPAQLFAL